jgi:NIMA (never in mitosis gene a)-related kinase
MPSSLDDYETLYSIGSGSYGTCKKIKRKKDGRVRLQFSLTELKMKSFQFCDLVSKMNGTGGLAVKPSSCPGWR